MRLPSALFSLSLLSLVACSTPAPRAPDGTASEPPPAPTGAAPSGSEEASDVMVFLLIGQSNMVGAPKPEPPDQPQQPRVEVLAYQDCPRPGHTYNQWSPAAPPLHGCGDGVGPGDAFGKVLADAYPHATIALVPLGISGVDIDFFVKGVVSTRRKEFTIPPDNHWSGAYEWVLERARLAQQRGKIAGILFHQGESDTGKAEWVDKVEAMVANLRTDLGLGEAPFVAGELLHSGCCGKWHNPLVAKLPERIESSKVVSASGLAGMDSAHFDLEGQRTLGARYAEAMLELLRAAPATGDR
jgi:hypothetical protein